jgi:hypothetical protein
MTLFQSRSLSNLGGISRRCLIMRVGAEFIPRTCIRFVRAFIANAHPCATRRTYIPVGKSAPTGKFPVTC